MTMRKSLLMSVAIVGLVAGGHFASAQSPSGQTGQKTEQPSGPSGGKMSPGQSSGQRSEQPGGAPHQGTAGQREEHGQSGMSQREEHNQGSKGQREERNQTGQREERNQSGQREERSKSGQREERNQGTMGQREERDRGQRDQNRMGQQPTQNENRTGQSTTTNTNVNLTSDQRTKIRETVIRRSDAPRVSRSEINFNLNVGTTVPHSVHVVALPSEVIEIHPAWRGFLYFLVGDEIVVVEPGSLRIVAVLPA